MQGTGLGSEAVDKALANLVRFRLVLRLAENQAQLNRGVEWGLQLESDLVDLEALRERANVRRKKGRAKTAPARRARQKRGGGGVRQPHLETASVEQKPAIGGDDEQLGGGDDEQQGGGVVHHLTQNPIKPTTQNPPSHRTSLRTYQTCGRAGWHFAHIAQNNQLNRKSMTDLQGHYADEHERACKFLGWILYAYSPQGKGLKDASGVSNAVRRLCAVEPQAPPHNFERLTKLGAQQLRELFDHDYTRQDLGNSVEAQIYRSHFAKLTLERKNDLYYRLFGEDAPAPAAKPRVAVETVLARRLKEKQYKKELA